jgi:vitamin B12 transporter
MKRIGRLSAAAMIAAWVAAARADDGAQKPATELDMDTLVVSPTRSEQTVAETAPSITVITGKQLEQKQVVTVADALREVPGVDVVENGSRGSLTSVFIRGADSDQVLVLIDGVRVNSTTLGAFDFSQLTPENIDRIEVLRGWGGTLYGSEAVGGVIQIFTRRGEGQPHGSISAAGGNAQTHREVGEFSGQTGILSYSGAVSHIRTDGFKPQNDDYENTVVNGRLDADLVDNGTARAIFRIGKSDFGDFEANNFLAAPALKARQTEQFDVVRADWTHSPFQALRYHLAFSYARDDQHFDNPADAFNTTSTFSEFLSQTMAGDGNATLTWLGGIAESTFGLEYESQSGDSKSLSIDPTFGESTSSFDHSVGNLAGYSLHQLFLVDRRLVLTGGVRVDDNQKFGLAVSPSGGVSYLLTVTQTRLRATYAQGFKAPTLNELFFPGFGNPDLGPEHSWEVDAGFDQPLWREQLLFSATYFHRLVSDLIVGVPQKSGLFLAENVGDSTVDGAEATIDAEVLPGVRVGGEYTYLDIDASAAGRVRRPKNSGSIHALIERQAILRSGDLFTMDTRLLLIGDRLDFDPLANFAPRETEGYERADLALAYYWPLPGTIMKRIKIFGRIENLFDRHYQETLGFRARPTNFLAGLGAEF